MNEPQQHKKKVGIRVRPNQFWMLVESMEKNPLANKPVSVAYKHTDRIKDWIELCRKLNGAGGGKKSVKSWQKSWADKKLEVKKKHKLVTNEMLKPIEERDDNIKLTKLERRIADLMGLGPTYGLAEEKNKLMPTGLVVPKVEDCPSSSASGSFQVLTPCPKSNQNFTQESTLTDFEGVFLGDTPSHLPNIQSPNRPESLPTQFVISQVSSIEDVSNQKLVEGQTAMVTALTRFAMALEKQNELQEKALEIKKQKAETFAGILSLLKDKL